ncbi:hypothetical protein Halru_0624 [Halovivax ruber XH-70]|uniref:CARDB domain-containing protein n=1 Tax=Halovivax ruber (strain DSM 18193 / JCM 13892 / XH-70) TaxID=797302 RepID=L0IAI4_HALRX|nr:right-handed parallel beta-helix repeat-containing protein [Halovivax ruber]AGB15251.1 hypothetical protein Halru_0624 [Halovivax ruber XH-70]
MSDQHTKSQESEKEQISRRKYLMGTGAAIGSTSFLALGSRSVVAAEYDLIEVNSGETFEYRLDNGETFENVLFDVSATGASVDLRATGSDWTIRNVGIRGEDGTGNQDATIICAVDGTSTGIIENVYLGDGDEGRAHTEGRSAIFVVPSHSGTLELRNVYIEGHTDNGLYASDPGHTAVPSNGGEVHVIDSYSGNNTASNIRLGTDGSYAENCCIWGGPHRGFWGYFEHTEVRNCHVGGMDNPDRAIEVGEPAYSKSGQAVVKATESSFSGARVRESTNEFIGDSNGTPERYVPDGCPTSAEAAARADGTGDDEPSLPDGSSLLAFVTEPDASLAGYEFYADGPVEFTEAPYDSPSGDSIEGGTFVAEDFIEEVDGAWHAGGVTGGGFGDAFLVDGAITDIQIDQPDMMWVELDGQARSPEEIIRETGDEDDDPNPVEGSHQVSIAEVTEPRGGERLDVTVRIENPGDETAEGDVSLLVGEDSQEVGGDVVAVEPGTAKTLTLGYETYPVKQDVEFPVRVESADDADERTVAVAAAGEERLEPAIVDSNAPVDAGAALEVAVRAENTGTVETTDTVRLLVGSDAQEVDSATVTVAPDDAATLTLGYATYPVRQDVEFPVSVETSDGAASIDVTVYGRN